MDKSVQKNGLLGLCHLIGGFILQIVIGESAWADSEKVVSTTNCEKEEDYFRLGHLRAGIGGIIVGIIPSLLILFIAEQRFGKLIVVFITPFLVGIIFTFIEEFTRKIR